MVLLTMKTLLFLLAALLCGGRLSGQEAAAPNLVPNPGFEEYAAPPIGWFYKGRHFTDVMKYWSSPTNASPDAFGPRVRVPAQWAEQDFGKQAPHGGSSMAGITCYGCEDGKPHCREYLQVPLLEPLVIGQEYEVRFWVSHLPRSLQIDRLGAHFTEGKTAVAGDARLAELPQVSAPSILRCPEGTWREVSGRFIAERAADHLIIGNFSSDRQTQTAAPCTDHLQFAYYYIDDVSVQPIQPAPAARELSDLELKKGLVVQLNNIFFETDEAELLPRSFAELNKLLEIMERHPDMVIQVNGHTDSRGTDAYNQELSERRARAVVDYLVAQGLEAGRAAYRGFGSSRPVADNGSEGGRQRNRRVEFVILKM